MRKSSSVIIWSKANKKYKTFNNNAREPSKISASLIKNSRICINSISVTYQSPSRPSTPSAPTKMRPSWSATQPLQTLCGTASRLHEANLDIARVQSINGCCIFFCILVLHNGAHSVMVVVLTASPLRLHALSVVFDFVTRILLRWRRMFEWCILSKTWLLREYRSASRKQPLPVRLKKKSRKNGVHVNTTQFGIASSTSHVQFVNVQRTRDASNAWKSVIVPESAKRNIGIADIELFAKIGMINIAWCIILISYLYHMCFIFVIISDIICTTKSTDLLSYHFYIIFLYHLGIIFAW